MNDQSASPRLTQQLALLEAAGFIQLSGDESELAYTFRHALQRDAAYQSLLKHSRRDLHRSVGLTLERLFPDRLAELAPELAAHFSEADDRARALTYSIRAAERAAANYANAEALIHFDRALALVRDDTDPASVASLVRGRGRVLQFTGRHEEAFAAYQRLEQMALTQQNPSLELDGLLLQAEMRSTPTALLDLNAGRTLCRRALALAQQLGDRAAEARIDWNLMLLHGLYQKASRGVVYGERSLAIARELGLREQMVFTLNDLARSYAASGQGERAISALNEVEPQWRAMGNLPMLADCLASLAEHQVTAGRFDEGLNSVTRAVEVSQLCGNRWNEAYALGNRSRVLVQRGEYTLAFAEAERIIALCRQAGLLILPPLVDAEMGWTIATLGAFERGLTLCDTALALATQMPPQLSAAVHAFRARIHCRRGDLTAAQAELDAARAATNLGDYTTDVPVIVAFAATELLLAQDDADAAAAALEPTIASVRRLGRRFYLPSLLHLLGLSQLRQLYLARADASLTEARAEAEERQANAVLWPILAAFAEVAETRGETTTAHAHRVKAAAIIIHLAEAILDDRLRATFLAQPDVRALL